MHVNMLLGSATRNWKVTSEWQVQRRWWECSWRPNRDQLFASRLLSLDFKDAWRKRASSRSIDACTQPVKHCATMFDWSTKMWQTWFSTRSLSVSHTCFCVWHVPLTLFDRYQMKLASIDNIRVNGIFYDEDNNIPEGSYDKHGFLCYCIDKQLL